MTGVRVTPMEKWDFSANRGTFQRSTGTVVGQPWTKSGTAMVVPLFVKCDAHEQSTHYRNVQRHSGLVQRKIPSRTLLKSKISLLFHKSVCSYSDHPCPCTSKARCRLAFMTIRPTFPRYFSSCTLLSLIASKLLATGRFENTDLKAAMSPTQVSR